MLPQLDVRNSNLKTVSRKEPSSFNLRRAVQINPASRPKKFKHDVGDIHHGRGFKKVDYSKWDLSHHELASELVKHQMDVHNAVMIQRAINDEENETAVSTDEADNQLLTSTGEDESSLSDVDKDEELDEAVRVQINVEAIRNQHEDGTPDGLLSEIQLIKDRHRQLEALTEAKNRSLVESERFKPKVQQFSPAQKSGTLRKLLLTKVQLQKDLEFRMFKDKTTVKSNRIFREEIKSNHVGLTWKPKWNPSQNLTNGKIHKSVHPVVDANKMAADKPYKPMKLGDLPPCVYLPKHVDAKTPVESALILDQFLKETMTLSHSNQTKSRLRELRKYSTTR